MQLIKSFGLLSRFMIIVEFSVNSFKIIQMVVLRFFKCVFYPDNTL